LTYFFKDFFDPGFDRKYKRTSLGSGVIIDGEKGFILTNAHVIQSTGTITVLLNDEREFTAQIKGSDRIRIWQSFRSIQNNHFHRFPWAFLKI
jgi:S1-C subfamily serine protease